MFGWIVAAVSVACGGGPSAPSATATPPQRVVETFTGQTRAIGNGCGGDSHSIVAADGAIALHLDETTSAAEMTAQVCAGGVDVGGCSIPQTRLAVGQTLEGTRRGQSSQTVKLLSAACVFGTPGTAPVVDYRVTVTYWR